MTKLPVKDERYYCKDQWDRDVRIYKVVKVERTTCSGVLLLHVAKGTVRWVSIDKLRRRYVLVADPPAARAA